MTQIATEAMARTPRQGAMSFSLVLPYFPSSSYRPSNNSQHTPKVAEEVLEVEQIRYILPFKLSNFYPTTYLLKATVPVDSA